MYIKPVMVMTQDGEVRANVRDPDRHDRLPPEGREVPMTDYWLRMLRDGGVVQAIPPVEHAATEHHQGSDA